MLSDKCCQFHVNWWIGRINFNDILDDEVKKYFKKEIDAEYENIEKMINKVLKKMILIKKSEVLEYFKKLKTLLKLNVW